MSSTERRQHRRILAPQLVGNLRLDEAVVGRGLRIEDISIGGLFVRAAHPLPVGRTVVIELQHPRLGQPLQVRGQVASLGGAEPEVDGRVGMGVRFDALSLDVLARLSRLLQELVASGAAFSLPGRAHTGAEAPWPSERTVPGGPQEEGTDGAAGAPAPAESPLRLVQVPTEGMERTERIPTLVLELSEAALQARIRSEPAPLPEATPGGEGTGEDTPQDASAADATASPVLMVQVRGLLMQLGEVSMQLAERERELARVQQENVRLQVELGRRDERILALETRLREREG